MQSLNDLVSSYKPLPDMKISEVNILLVGQINAGKSSFFNSLNSIFRGEISSRACAGTSPHSLTTNASILLLYISFNKKCCFIAFIYSIIWEEGISSAREDIYFFYNFKKKLSFFYKILKQTIINMS